MRQNQHVAVALLLFVLGACASAQTSSPTTEVEVTSTGELDRTASAHAQTSTPSHSSSEFAHIDLGLSAFDIAAELSPCTEPGEIVPIELVLSGTTRWFDLTRIETTPAEAHLAPSSVALIDMADGSIRNAELKLHPSYVAVGLWALEQSGSRLFVPVDDVHFDVPLALTMFISLPGKGVFFSGECQHVNGNLRFQELYGDDAAEVLEALPGKLGTELDQLLDLPAG